MGVLLVVHRMPIMFISVGRNEFRVGTAPDCDRDIEVVSVAESGEGSWTELWLIRDIFLIIVVFRLVSVFAVQPVVVEGTSMAAAVEWGAVCYELVDQESRA